MVLDVSTPVINGLEAARELNVLMQHVPPFMFTNNAGGIVEKEASSAVISKSDTDGLKQLLARAKALLGRDGAGTQRASRETRTADHAERLAPDRCTTRA